MLKIVFMGCVKMSQDLLGAVLTVPQARVVGVVTRTQSDFNADFVCLESVARKQGIDCFRTDVEPEKDLPGWIRNLKADVIYCFGWSKLLGADVIRSARLGAVGYHPSLLPQNRGRHPIVWALALGLKKTGSSFFFVNERPDEGRLLSQKTVAIKKQDDALSLYNKLTATALSQVRTITAQLAKGRYTAKAQGQRRANYWRRRGAEDGRIDWRMSSNSIYNLIRALTKPYVGADCVYQGKRVRIWSSKKVSFTKNNLEPGKVLRSGRGGIWVKCGEGAIVLLRHEFSTLPKIGEYL